ncbi:hypothetical protein [Bizionia paragorgiae]|uniref:hypothetical protein n=1 Tax=Bizionia paragorgiae TaxID=283786 RepID=UPI003A947860
MEDNIYIKAMEIGYNHNNGIYYSQMKAYIERDLNIQMSKAREYTFISWFLNHFQSKDSADALPDSIYKLKYYILQGEKHNERAYAEIMTQIFYMKGETVKQYLDYVELKEARMQSKNAQQSSTIAIFIAIITLLISVYFSATTPQPPFEVKVIDKPIPIKKQIHIYNDASKSIEPDNEKD